MKVVSRNILLIFFLGFLVRCNDDEVSSRNYPRLKTLPVTEITAEGANFNAEIIFRGDFEVINYGFVWGEYGDPNINNSDRAIYNENIQSDQFTRRIQTTLKENTSYFVRAFVETDDFIVYGENIPFTSLGSKAPELRSFSPLNGTWGDTIKIVGRNFSFKNTQNIATLGSIEAEIIESTDTLLVIAIPTIKNQQSVKIGVSIVGNSAISDEYFNYLTPVIDDISPLSGTFRDTITIHGDNFGKIIDHSSVWIGEFESEIIHAEPSTLKFVVSDNIVLRLSPIRVVSVGNEINTHKNFELKSPIISRLEPDTAKRPNETIIVHGNNFNPHSSYNKVLIEGYEASIISATKNQLEIILPDQVIPFYNLSVFKSSDLQLIIGEQSTSPNNSLRIHWHSKWTRKKDFPGNVRYAAAAFALNGHGYYGTGYDRTNYLNDFWKYDPISDSWEKLDDLPGPARSEAVAFSIDNKGYLGLGINRDLEGYYPYDDFYLFDPENNKWNHLNDFGGHGRANSGVLIHDDAVLIIGGEWAYNNENSGSSITNEVWKYNIAADTWSQTTQFPVSTYKATGFSMNDGGYVFDYNRLYLLKEGNWIDQGIDMLLGWDLVSFSIKGKGYLGFGNAHHGGTPSLWEFEAGSTQLTNYTLPTDYTDWRYSASVFKINDKAYVIGGVSYYGARNDVWEFDPAKPEL